MVVFIVVVSPIIVVVLAVKKDLLVSNVLVVVSVESSARRLCKIERITESLQTLRKIRYNIFRCEAFL